MRKLALGLAGVLLWGCGSSTGNPPAGGTDHGGSQANGGNATGGSASASGSSSAGSATSGNSTGGQGASGSSGTAGSSPVGDTPAEACIAYARAACERRVACQGFPPTSCANIADKCPDLYLAAGSTRTVESLKACAIERANQPCAEVLSGIDPECATPGTRAIGEPCLFASQCASFDCSARGNACGSCLAVVGEGQSCAPTGPDCGNGFACENDKCVAHPLAAPSEPGQTCGQLTRCRDGFCNQDGKCQLLGAVADSCLTTVDCQPGLICSTTGHDCRPPGKMGEPCVEDAETSQHFCADSTCYLDTPQSAGTCGPYAQLAQPCVLPVGTTQALNAIDCVAGAHCGQGNLCQPDLEIGQPTELGNDCKDGLDRVCPANAPDRNVCDQYICGKPGFKGDACAPDGNPCNPAFECVANECTPRASQGLFEAACGQP